MTIRELISSAERAKSNNLSKHGLANSMENLVEEAIENAGLYPDMRAYAYDDWLCLQVSIPEEPDRWGRPSYDVVCRLNCKASRIYIRSYRLGSYGHEVKQYGYQFKAWNTISNEDLLDREAADVIAEARQLAADRHEHREQSNAETISKHQELFDNLVRDMMALNALSMDDRSRLYFQVNEELDRRVRDTSGKTFHLLP